MFTRLDPRDDRGVAMLMVVMVMAVLVALGTAAVLVSTTNIKNAGRDRFATTAQGAAEAAVSAAESYLETVNGQVLACSPNCGSATPPNPWGDKTNPKSLSFPGGRTAKVWIQLMQAYNPPTYKSFDYVIHAVGKSASAIGVRTIDQEVSVAPLDFPFGIYVDNKINDQGSPTITNESVFSRTCIDSRNKITFSGIDPYYGIPAAAHSAQYITNDNQTSCNSNLADERMNDTRAIHYDPTAGGTQHNYCAPSTTGGTPVDTRYDQDGLGGLFSQDLTDGTTCSSAPNQYTSTSAFDNNQLTTQYNFSPKGLTDSEYAMLKSVAQSQGNYYTSNSSIVWPSATAQPNAVVYFDVPSGTNVNVGSGDVAGYAWDSTDTTCSQAHPSIIIVVRGGDLTFGSGVSTTGALFIPEGKFTASGTINVVGTIFAAYAKITGGANVSLNSCYIKNIPGPILSVTPMRFHEVDR